MRDYHMHTTYSPDAEASMRDQVQAALRAGLTEICLTDHLDIGHPDPVFKNIPDYDRYFADIATVRAEFPGMTIRAGIEAGEQPCATDATLSVVTAHPFDYVLLSQHLVDGTDPYTYSEFIAGKTPAQAYRRYAECVWESINRFSDFDCLAHFGYCSKFAPHEPGLRPFDRDYAPDEVDAVLTKLARDGKALEINTSGLKNGGTDTIPGADIVRRFAQLGGEFVMFGSDAHYTEYVGYEFARARQQALDCGIKYTLAFDRRKATPVRIEAE